MKAKALRVAAALRLNNGGSAGTGPGLDAGDSGLCPIEWSYLDSIKAPFVPYGYWRW